MEGYDNISMLQTACLHKPSQANLKLCEVLSFLTLYDTIYEHAELVALSFQYFLVALAS